jgi:hypothetical protein
MGKRAETIAASSGDSESNGRDSCQAHHVGGSPQEDRSGCTSEVGKDTCRKEGGVETTEPAASMRQALMLEVNYRMPGLFS